MSCSPGWFGWSVTGDANDLVAGLPDVGGTAPLAHALGAHLDGLLHRDIDLLARAAEAWRSMGQRVEHALALLDLAEATPEDERGVHRPGGRRADAR